LFAKQRGIFKLSRKTPGGNNALRQPSLIIKTLFKICSLIKKQLKRKNRTKTASSGSSRNSSFPSFSDQSSDTEQVYSRDDDEKEEKKSCRSTPGAKAKLSTSRSAE